MKFNYEATSLKNIDIPNGFYTRLNGYICVMNDDVVHIDALTKISRGLPKDEDGSINEFGMQWAQGSWRPTTEEQYLLVMEQTINSVMIHMVNTTGHSFKVLIPSSEEIPESLVSNCCGAKIKNTDSDICPECHEHCVIEDENSVTA